MSGEVLTPLLRGKTGSYALPFAALVGMATLGMVNLGAADCQAAPGGMAVAVAGAEGALQVTPAAAGSAAPQLTPAGVAGHGGSTGHYCTEPRAR